MIVPNKPPLKILLWNANGLLSRKVELELLLTNTNVDVILLTETHLHARHYFHIQGYKTYRADHPNTIGHGGAAILIKNTIPHHGYSNLATDSYQVSSVLIQLLPHPIVFSSIYCSPNKRIYHPDFLTIFQSLSTHFIAGGDYNGKHPQWGSRSTNTRGRCLNDVIHSNNFQVHSQPNPTYWPSDPNRIPDILDFFISSGLGNISLSLHTLDDLSSDHSPILLTMSSHPIPSIPKPTLTPGPVRWPLFRKTIETFLDLKQPIKTNNEVDKAAEMFTQAIQFSAKVASNPQRTPTRHSPTKPPLPSHIKELLAAKRKARSKWQKFRYPSDKVLFNKLTKKLKNEFIKFRSQNYDEYLSSLTTKDNSLWLATKRILQFQQPASPLQRVDGTWARSLEEKANEFANHLENTFSPNPDNNPIHTSRVLQSLVEPIPLSLPPKPFSPSEIKYAIHHLPLKKSPGPDLITAVILRNLPHKGLMFLTLLFNSILRTTHFPTSWKHSAVILIPKPNKPPTSPSSYRPISLLSIIAKLFEKLIYKRILSIVESHNVIPDHQFGFRSRHSTTQQAFRVVDSISSALELGTVCSGVFLDVAQAFDRVWHPGLLYKLKSFLPSTYYLILMSYLKDRTFSVQIGSVHSSPRPIKAGVPQGSILSPLLYSIFTSDLPTSPLIVTNTFADDTAILSSSHDPIKASEQLQSHLNAVEDWFLKWRIKVNPEKCNNVTFTLRKCECPPISLLNVQIPQTETVRYLGFHLDRRLTWKNHIITKRKELNKRYGLLRRLLGPKSKLSTNNKLTIYKTVLRPIWTYGIELWGSAKPTNIKTIQSFQSKVLRKILNAPFYVSNSTIHKDLNIPFVSDLAKLRFLSFHSKLSIHPNPLGKLLSSDTIPGNPPRRLRRKWPRDNI